MMILPQDEHQQQLQDTTTSTMEVGHGPSDSMKESGRTVTDSNEESALVQIRWKENHDHQQEYNEITVRGPIKLKLSMEDPTDFRLKIKPDDAPDEPLEIPLPASIDWKINSESHEMPQDDDDDGIMRVKVLTMSFFSPEFNSKIKLRIGMPMNDKDMEYQANKFARTLLLANTHSGMVRNEPEGGDDDDNKLRRTWSVFGIKARMASARHNNNSGGSSKRVGFSAPRMHANPLLRRTTRFQRAKSHLAF